MLLQQFRTIHELVDRDWFDAIMNTTGYRIRETYEFLPPLEDYFNAICDSPVLMCSGPLGDYGRYNVIFYRHTLDIFRSIHVIHRKNAFGSCQSISVFWTQGPLRTILEQMGQEDWPDITFELNKIIYVPPIPCNQEPPEDLSLPSDPTVSPL